MLDGSGYTESEIEIGADGLAGLAHLTVMRHDACIDHCPGCGHLRSEYVGQFLQLCETLLAAYSAAAGDEDLGLGDIHLVLLLTHLLDEADPDLGVVKLGLETDD